MYGKPPQSTKFKPGQSGNPNGRPKCLNGQEIIEIMQQIIKLYLDAKSEYKTLSNPAHQKLQRLKNSLSN